MEKARAAVDEARRRYNDLNGQSAATPESAEAERQQELAAAEAELEAAEAALEQAQKTADANNEAAANAAQSQEDARNSAAHSYARAAEDAADATAASQAQAGVTAAQLNAARKMCIRDRQRASSSSISKIRMVPPCFSGRYLQYTPKI